MSDYFKLKIGMRGANNGLLDLIKDLPENISMIEVGCYAGESTLMFLQSGKINKLYAVDPWNKDIDKSNLNENEIIMYDNIEWAEWSFHRRIAGKFPNTNKIKIKDYYENTNIEKVDFIYIDGDHRYEYVKKDIQKALLNEGILAGHDYDQEGVKRAVDELVGKVKVYRDTSWLKL